MQTIVVTGATSMIGVAIIEECLAHDVEKVYAVIRPNSTNIYRLPTDIRVKVIECSSKAYSQLPFYISEKCDVFYHLAWDGTGKCRNRDIKGQAENITYAVEALRCAEQLGCSKFIGAGSQAEYGKLDIEKIGVNSPVNPIQAYGIAKYAAGRLVLEESKQLGLDCAWVRVFSVYGKYDKPTTMISSAVHNLLAGEPVAFTAAEQRWDYLYSEDAGRAFYLIAERAEGNKVYCLGSGRTRMLREYIEIIGKRLAPGKNLGIGKLPYAESTVMNLCADISELETDTGWRPMVEFEEGISMYIESVRKEHC